MRVMKLLLAAFLAAIVSFVWGYVSWMQLGWHNAGVRDFKDEVAVAEVIKENATNGRGIYMLPYERKPQTFASEEEKAQLVAAHEKAYADGPYMYAIVRPGKTDVDMTGSLIRSFSRSLVACILVAALMTQLVIGYAGRIGFAAALGAFAGLAADMQTWIWFELPTRDLIVNMADHFIEWSLAGAVLGLFLGKDPTAKDHH